MVKKWIRLIFIGSLYAAPLAAQQAFIEGFDYQRIDPVVETSNPQKVVVTEIFWYGCPHCFRFEPIVQKWAKTIPDSVIFEQLPSAAYPPWTTHARTFYALKKIGVLQRLHQKLFDALHVERLRLNDLETIVRWLAEQGIDEDEFRQIYASPEVDGLVRKGRKKEILYGNRGVPAVVVNGKYLTSGTMAGSFERMIEIINFLVENELKS